MAFLFRRLIVSLLVPFLWRTWRDRRRARRTAPAVTEGQGLHTAAS
jgi:hypothetical protein